MMTLEEIETLQKIIYAEYLNVHSDPIRTMGFQRLLGHLSFEQCQEAAYALMALPHRQHPVTSSEILNFIKEKNRPLMPASEDDNTSFERRQQIVSEMHALFPDLFN